MATELLSTNTGPNGRVPMTHESLAADPGEVTPHLRGAFSNAKSYSGLS